MLTPAFRLPLLLIKSVWLLGLVGLGLPSMLLGQNVNVAIDATHPVRTVDERVFGINAVMWDGQTGSAQTISLVQAAGIRTIRIPGGSASDEYNWSLNKSYDFDHNMVNNWTWASGFDSFAKLITGNNAQAFVTVNYGSGTPEEAAAWVAYTNASASLLGTGSDITWNLDSKNLDWKSAGYWSALRSASPLASDDGRNFLRAGRSNPYAIKYWEIGNECYGSWERDTHAKQWDPITYANQAKIYIAKMKAVDPTIKVGVVAEVGEDTIDSLSPANQSVTNPRTGLSHKGWTPVMLTTLKTLGVTPDFLIYHRYEQAPKHDQPGNPETDAGLLQKAKTWPNDEADLIQQLKDYLGTAAAANVELTVTENNSVYSQPGKQTTSLVNGLYLADSVGNILQTKFNSLLWWDLRNGTDATNNNDASLYGARNYGDYGILSTPPSPLVAGQPTTAYDPYPTYYAMKLLSHFARGGDTVVKATSDNSLLSVFAAKRADGSLSLLLVNKDPANPQNVAITLTGHVPGATATLYAYGKPQDNAGSSADITTASLPIGGTSFSTSLASYSITVLTIPAGVVTTAPAFTTQPVSQSITLGSSVTFTTSATGTPAPGYQWLKNGTNIAGATGSSFTIATVASADAGNYTVVATNTAGSVTSSTAVLTVVLPKNAASYDSTTFPATATSGATINFTYSVTDTGSQAWGANHYLALRDATQTNLAFASLSGVAMGASKTGSFTLVAPTAVGTYTYYIQGVEAGVEFFSTRATLTLTVTGAPKNAASYDSTTFPATTTSGATINFTYNVTNTGSQAWGANHYLALRDATQTNLAFASLSGVAIGASKTGSFTLVAPTAVGTYTYYIQGVEAGVEFFSTRATLTLTVTGAPKNAASYNSTTFPASASVGTTINFTYSVTNTGTQAWGANHYLALRDASQTNLAFASLSGVAVGASKTSSFTLVAPSVVGTYTYYVQGVEAGVEFFSTRATLTLTVTGTPKNAMSYQTTTFPVKVTAGTAVHFSYHVTNTGTQAWGGQHYLSLRDGNGTYLEFIPISGVAVNGGITVNLDFTAPATAGTYTYYVQGVENGVEFFGTQATLSLIVPATPLANAMQYNATNFPVSAAAGSTVNFTYNVTNTGTQAWGAQHYVSLRNSAGTYLAFAPVNGIAIGASTTVNLSLVAPATSGTYTYYVEGVENGVEFFSTTATLILTVP